MNICLFPAATRTTTVGGLGGIPGNAGAPRTSSLALGGDITNSWLGRGENRALQELPVPPEILASVEELKYDNKGKYLHCNVGFIPIQYF